GHVPAVMLGVGASFDFYAGNVKESPQWLQNIGLEWLYRLAQEPRRLWYRYLILNPRFMFLAGVQLLGGRKEMERGPDQIISDLILQKIDQEKFLQQFPAGLLENQDYTNALLSKGLKNKDAGEVQRGLLLLSIQHQVHSASFNADLLCELLQEEWHYSHEDI